MTLHSILEQISACPVTFPGQTGFFVSADLFEKLRALDTSEQNPEPEDPFLSLVNDLEVQLRAVNLRHLTASSKERQELDLERGRITSNLARARKNVELRRDI